MTVPSTEQHAKTHPKPFQFRIVDVALVMTLVALGLAAVVQMSAWLGIAFAVSLFLCLAFVWQWLRVGEVIVVFALCAVLIGCLLSAMPSGRHGIASRRAQCSNNLRQIGLALHTYHDVYGSFPPAYIADSKGRPMHSWRVLLLPYLEQESLYKQYRFSEPWDGPNNRLLAGALLKIYSCPGDHPPGGSLETSYVAIVGPGSAWPGEKALSLADFKDGTTNVILVAEVHDSGIHWMEPRDLHVLQMAPGIDPPAGQGISSEHPPLDGNQHGAQVLFADAHVRYLPPSTPPDVLQTWIGIDDGTLPEPP